MNLRRGGGTPSYVYHLCGNGHGGMPSCRRARSRRRKPPATTVGADSLSAREPNAAAHGPGTYTRRPCVTQTQK